MQVCVFQHLRSFLQSVCSCANKPAQLRQKEQILHALPTYWASLEAGLSYFSMAWKQPACTGSPTHALSQLPQYAHTLMAFIVNSTLLITGQRPMRLSRPLRDQMNADLRDDQG